MNANNLLTDLTRLGILLEAQGDRLRYWPRSAVTPDLAKCMTSHKGELLAILTGSEYRSELTTEANEQYWNFIDDADRNYLLAPRTWPSPCPWCGGRLRHSKACDDLRVDWEPVLPFGKFKGHRVDETPLEYLAWLARKKTDLPGDLRLAIEKRVAKCRDNSPA